MAWNESGGDDKDPWGNRGNQGPPDLDEAIRKLQSQLSGLFGGGGKGPSSGGVSGPSKGMIWLGVVAAVVAYIFSGINARAKTLKNWSRVKCKELWRKARAR